MKETYNDSMAYVYKDEGGYSNDAGDPGGPTNYGITIIDARKYWKADATANDVKSMPKSVAAEIYEQHYAHPLAYDSLPAGVDYAIMDYGINSGISRSTKVLQRIVGVPVDGIMGPITVTATNKRSSSDLINAIYDERISFLQGLSTWKIFGKGWASRCKRGRVAALQMAEKYKSTKPSTMPPQAHKTVAGAVIVTAGTAVAAYPHIWPYVLAGTIFFGFVTWFIIRSYNKGK